MEKIKAIILAGGEGRRMKANAPKALVHLGGKPMISYLLSAIRESALVLPPTIVIGFQAEKVKRALGGRYNYVYQAEPLGTGHAVLCCRPSLTGTIKQVMVLYGDHPFVSAETISRLAKIHLGSGATLTMAATTVPDFTDWRGCLYDFGRIIRDKGGNVIKIVEKKDATVRQLKIREVNPAYFCFNARWLWGNIGLLKNNNAAGEYYLTDMLGIAFKQEEKIVTVDIPPKEALGINTKEQLQLAGSLIALGS